MSFPFIVQLDYGMEKDFGTVKLHPLGTLGIGPDGARYKYCLAGNSALNPGLLNTYITTPTLENIVTVAHAVGTEVLTVDTVVADTYEDGYLLINQGTGIGEIYPIKSNTTTTLTLNPGDGLKTAWSTGDTDIEMFPSPYTLLVVNPIDAQQKPVCVANVLVTASNYFWGQVEGFCALLIYMSAGAGLELDEKSLICATGSGNQGRGMVVESPIQSTNYFGHQVIGYLVEEADIATDDDAALVYLTLD